MSETHTGVKPAIGDKLRPGEDTQGRSGVDQQETPRDPHPTAGVTQGHADPQRPKHGSDERATSRSSTGLPQPQHDDDTPPSAEAPAGKGTGVQH